MAKDRDLLNVFPCYFSLVWVFMVSGWFSDYYFADLRQKSTLSQKI